MRTGDRSNEEITTVERGGHRGKSIVVTGCDAHHYEMAAELLLSLRSTNIQSFAVGFIQVGESQPPEAIVSRADIVAHVSAGDVALKPNEGFKLAYLAVKASLPDIFPGYDTYVWLDADTWIQREVGLCEVAAAAQYADIAIHPQIDPNYFSCQFPDNYTLSAYRRLFGEKELSQLARFPMVNAGVFAAVYSSPLWRLWKETLQDVRQRLEHQDDRFFSDQIPLHRLIYRGRLRISPLRAINNWLALHSIPRLDPTTGLLTAPSPPFEPINIIHLVGNAKSQGFTLNGGPASLRYPEFKRMQADLLGFSLSKPA